MPQALASQNVTRRCASGARAAGGVARAWESGSARAATSSRRLARRDSVDRGAAIGGATKARGRLGRRRKLTPQLVGCRPVGPFVRLRLILLCALAALLTTPAAAGAARGACLAGVAGPACTVWTGTVTSVEDGDTITVDLDRDRSRVRYRVRVAGINAMEQTIYAARHRAGECHAV